MVFDQRRAVLRTAAATIVSVVPRPLRGPASFALRFGGRVVTACLVVLLAAASVSAQQPPQVVFNRQLRDEALRAIPFGEMGQSAQAKLQSVLSRPTVYRHLPAQVVDCDPDMHVFLLRYPEVVVNIWQLMGVTKVKVNRTGPLTFDAVDGAGTVSRAELMYGTPEIHVYYAEGSYDGPLFQKPVAGSCVLLVRSSYTSRNGKPSVADTLDVFAKLDHLGAEIIVKTLYPAVGRAIDYNFAESVKFVGQVSQAAELNGPGMQRLAVHLRNVQPEVQESFAKHVEVAYQRAVLRKGNAAEPLASTASSRSTQAAEVPAAEAEVSSEAEEHESTAPVVVPSAEWDAAGSRDEPMFRR